MMLGTTNIKTIKVVALNSQIYFRIKLYMFRTVLLSIIRSFSMYKQQWYTPHRFADSLLTMFRMELSFILTLLASCQQNFMAYTTAVYSKKLLMMDRGTARKMYSFIPKNLRN